MAIKYELRHASHPEDVKLYDTARLRKEFLIEKIFEPNQINLTYTGYDRFITGGAFPLDKSLELISIDPLKASYFCERREVGVINIGGKGMIMIDGKKYILSNKEALYIGKGTQNISFESYSVQEPAMFYINSAPATHAYPTKKISINDTNIIELGSQAQANKRRIFQYIVKSNIETCQLQMGLTELEQGNIWNTMPAHTHNRRMEVYFYVGLPKGQGICHFMGEKHETRNLWLQNNQAVISPSWSIHSAAGTSAYFFIWGMAGENLDFTDMDSIEINDLK